MYDRLFAFSISLILFSSSARAIGLDAAIMESLRSSNLVHGQERIAEIANGDRWRRFIFHEPQFSYNNIDSGNQESWGLTLATPFPGKALAYTEFDRAKAEAERVEISAKKQDVARQVTEAYLDCASSRSLLEIQKSALHDLETMERSLSAMYESGHASQAERIGAELQARQTHADVEVSLDKMEVSCRKWLRILAKEGAEFLPDKLPDDLQEETLYALGHKSAAESRGESAQRLAVIADHLRWWAQAPDLNWNYSRNHYLFLPGSPTGKEWTTSVGVSLTIPLFFIFGESVEAQRARAMAHIDQRNAEVETINARSERELAAQEYQRGKRRIRELREKDLALAQALVQSTLSAYKIGKLGFAELLMSRKTLADLRAQEVQLQVAVIQARLHCLNTCTSPTPQERKEL